MFHLAKIRFIPHLLNPQENKLSLIRVITVGIRGLWNYIDNVPYLCGNN